MLLHFNAFCDEIILLCKQLLRDGHRMERPASCPIEVYLVMRDCWNHDPSNRPTFSKLITDLDKILTSECQVRLNWS